MKKLKFLFLSLAIIIISKSCKSDPNPQGVSKQVVSLPPTVKTSLVKPNINVYIENSASMDGYVTDDANFENEGDVDFEDVVYDYLTDIKRSQVTDDIRLFYINSEEIPLGSDIGNFIEKLGPTTFKEKGGNRGVSDISNVLKSILGKTEENEISILITDGIFSPGKGKDAQDYLNKQQISIKDTIAGYLERFPKTSIIIYKLSAKFISKKGKVPEDDVCYYNKEDKKFFINTIRPYYIWLIGPFEQLNRLCNKVPESEFMGSGVENVFSISPMNKKVNYAIKMGSGNFDLDKKSPKTTIKNLKKDTKGKQNSVRFSVNADFSGFLLNETYLNDFSNYSKSNNDFEIKIDKATVNNHGFTHQLRFSSDNVHKGNISVWLNANIPNWVEDVNDDDGSAPIEGKTFGIKYQIQGIYDAFTKNNDFYTEIKININ